MATWLVTGGCGFIGSHLADALMARGDEVRILDDLSTGKRGNVPAQAEVIVGDVADQETVARAMAGVDGCFHLAAVASVQRCNEDWVGSHRTNLTGSVNVFDVARRCRPDGKPVPVVYASSSAVYGDNPNVPLSEDATTGPLSAYGADKLGSELHAKIAAHIHGVPTVGFRFFNVYGPRQDPHSPYSGVIAIFAERLGRGEGVTVHGDGEQTRDFVYVIDVVRFLIAAMDAGPMGAAVYNICTGLPTSVNDLAHAVAGLSGTTADISHSEPRQGDIRTSVGDPASVNAVFGFAAEIPLQEGLRRTLSE